MDFFFLVKHFVVRVCEKYFNIYFFSLLPLPSLTYGSNLHFIQNFGPSLALTAYNMCLIEHIPVWFWSMISGPSLTRNYCLWCNKY